MTLKLGFLASHGGSCMKAIVGAIKDGRLKAQARVVVSNNSKSAALAFAREEGIPAYHLSEYACGGPDHLDQAILDTLMRHDVNLVVLSGYMKKLGPKGLSQYEDRILNTHPALLPKFGGKGMYGRYVYEAILAAREPVTGVTIHTVDEHYDHGRIIRQAEVSVSEDDTVETLTDRVQARERELFVELLQSIAAGQIKVGKLG